MFKCMVMSGRESREIHAWFELIIKLNTDDMGRFHVRYQSGNCYTMLEYHVETNAILVSAFQSRNDRHRTTAYNIIMSSLKSNGHIVDIQVLENEASDEYRHTIVDEWN